MFRITEHLAVAVDLLVGKTVQIFTPAVADESGAEDEIHHHAVVVFHAAARSATRCAGLAVWRFCFCAPLRFLRPIIEPERYLMISNLSHGENERFYNEG